MYLLGELKAHQVYPILTKSKLPASTLATIWKLADRGKRNFLEPLDFCYAFHLTTLAKAGKTLPSSRENTPSNIFTQSVADALATAKDTDVPGEVATAAVANFTPPIPEGEAPDSDEDLGDAPPPPPPSNAPPALTDAERSADCASQNITDEPRERRISIRFEEDKNESFETYGCAEYDRSNADLNVEQNAFDAELEEAAEISSQRDEFNSKMAEIRAEEEEREAHKKANQRVPGSKPWDGPDAPQPAWTLGKMEQPAGEEALGSAIIAVYTKEQQTRLGVDKYGEKKDAVTIPRMSQDELMASLDAIGVSGSTHSAPVRVPEKTVNAVTEMTEAREKLNMFVSQAELDSEFERIIQSISAMRARRKSRRSQQLEERRQLEAHREHLFKKIEAALSGSVFDEPLPGSPSAKAGTASITAFAEKPQMQSAAEEKAGSKAKLAAEQERERRRRFSNEAAAASAAKELEDQQAQKERLAAIAVRQRRSSIGDKKNTITESQPGVPPKKERISSTSRVVEEASTEDGSLQDTEVQHQARQSVQKQSGVVSLGEERGDSFAVSLMKNSDDDNDNDNDEYQSMLDASSFEAKLQAQRLEREANRNKRNSMDLEAMLMTSPVARRLSISLAAVSSPEHDIVMESQIAVPLPTKSTSSRQSPKSVLSPSEAKKKAAAAKMAAVAERAAQRKAGLTVKTPTSDKSQVQADAVEAVEAERLRMELFEKELEKRRLQRDRKARRDSVGSLETFLSTSPLRSDSFERGKSVDDPDSYGFDAEEELEEDVWDPARDTNPPTPVYKSGKVQSVVMREQVDTAAIKQSGWGFSPEHNSKPLDTSNHKALPDPSEDWRNQQITSEWIPPSERIGVEGETVIRSVKGALWTHLEHVGGVIDPTLIGEKHTTTVPSSSEVPQTRLQLARLRAQDKLRAKQDSMRVASDFDAVEAAEPVSSGVETTSPGKVANRLAMWEKTAEQARSPNFMQSPIRRRGSVHTSPNK